MTNFPNLEFPVSSAECAEIEAIFIELMRARDAAPDARSDIADGVIASLAVGKAGVGEHVHQVGGALERHEVILHILPRRKVPFAAREFIRDTRKLLDLPRRRQPPGDLDADHLHARLALAVNAMFEAKRPEFIVRDLARNERRSLLAEDFNLLPDGLIVLILKGFAL